ncbi:outer membrane lipoprotein-sorting protein [Oceanidesulfovibrio indonesiensis]|nr:outer membrane lipoprotein-sorting protein [Oceanidesulfovibrio indonesiensis]
MTMRNMVALLGAILLVLSAQTARAVTEEELVQRAHDYMRGQTSVSVVDMTIHRPNWERTMTIKAWTKGVEDSIFKIIAPAKDKDNGTLKLGQEMWTYNPKINRVIKIPPSMMSQSWMGSDFSNNDLAKSDTILTDYTHEIIGEEEHEGKTVYVVESIPKPRAPVVWGKQVLKVREDDIYISQEFFDEDMESVKILEMLEINEMGGRLYPTVWKMHKTDETEEYTLLDYKELEFGVELDDDLFTVQALKRSLR